MQTSTFEKVMRDESDAQLLRIVSELRQEYQPLAVEAAEAELTKRNLSKEQIRTAQLEAEATKQEVKSKEQEPLSRAWKTFLLFFPPVTFGLLIFASVLSHKGYVQRRNDLIRWTIYGIFFWVSLCVMIYLAGL